MEEALLNDNEGCFMSPPPSSPLLSRTQASTYHVPVLRDECIRGLAIKPGGTYVDCTLGGGGHFQAIVNALGNGGRALGIDRDPEAISWSNEHIDKKQAAVDFKQARFSEIGSVLREMNIDAVDGVLLDLGVSSRQILEPARGFSYMKDARLDMRMNPADKKMAADVLEESSADELARIFADYGEIRNPVRMAETIKNYMKHSRLSTSEDLKKCLHKEYGAGLKIKVLAKLFQALRISVNGELSELQSCCEQAIECLKSEGRLVIISYHSLEDRFVKNFMRDLEKGCLCPPAVPVCICGKLKKLNRINTKVISASIEEISRNPASRSARLRVAEKI